MRVVILAVVVAACGSSEPTETPIDAARPVVDPAPYYQDCTAPTECPAPYACTTETSFHTPAPRDVCLIPCSADVECPVGHFCMGVTQEADIGALYHCRDDV